MSLLTPRSLAALVLGMLLAQGMPQLHAQSKTGLWPQFRGPTGQGLVPDANVPLTWGKGSANVTKIALPGLGASSPIVVGDRIFLTCFTGFGAAGQPPGTKNTRMVVCLDRSGKIVWNKEVPSRLPESPRTREEHGYATSTPVADSERLYVFFGKSGVFAFDHDGKQLWHADVGSGVNEGWGTGASPMLAGDLLIVNASVESKSLVALDKKTGKEKWRLGGINESWNTPILVSVPGGQTELVLAIQGKVLGVDPASGQQLWTSRTDIGWYMVPSLVAHGGVVYCVGGRSGIAALAVRAGGRGDVTRTHRLWTRTKGSNVTSPLYHQGYLYWMNDVLGLAYCADAKTGTIVYEERLGRGGQVYASPVLAGDKIYYTTRTGTTYVVKAQPKFEQLATNDLGERMVFNASPAVADGRIYLRADRYLFAIGK